MNILFFTKSGINTASSRQRVYHVADELNQEDIKTTTDLPNSADFSNKSIKTKIKLGLKIFNSIRCSNKDDVVYLHRPIYSRFQMATLLISLWLFNRYTIFDFDDAIYTHSRKKTLLFIKIADKVVVGGHELKNWADKYSDSVHIIPTGIKLPQYKKYEVNHQLKDVVTIGWVGSGKYHEDNLKLLLPIFKKLSKRVDFRFVLVGAQEVSTIHETWGGIKGVDVEVIDELDWGKEDAVPSLINTFDIGVMPLQDTIMDRGKCAFKAIEYMGCKVPVVASPVGENNYLIDDGVNGYLPRSTQDWVKDLEELAKSFELRERVGEKGQETISDGYTIKLNVQKILRILSNS